MIGFLRGIVYSYSADSLLLDVNGVGYRLNFYHPASLKIGEEVTIYTYQHVREDAILLFGFLSLEEYELFMKLISVKGIGPKIACGILASGNLNEIYTAIENGDVAYMKKMPGVGSKAASQIILDLKGKLVETSNNNSKGKQEESAEINEVITALKGLGYKNSEVEAILPSLRNSEGSVNELLKQALMLLAK